MWIDFKYEKLQDYCFGCGKLGHARSQCTSPIHHKSPLHYFHLGPCGFGPWIKAGNSGLKALTWLEFLKEEAADSSPSFSDTSNTQVSHLPQETNQNTPPTSLKSNPQAIIPVILASPFDTSHPNPISPSPYSHSPTTKLLPDPITTQKLSTNTL